jgi:hypothetical protein
MLGSLDSVWLVVFAAHCLTTRPTSFSVISLPQITPVRQTRGGGHCKDDDRLERWFVGLLDDGGKHLFH